MRSGARLALRADVRGGVHLPAGIPAGAAVAARVAEPEVLHQRRLSLS